MKYYLEYLKQLKELALFAGAGGGLLATHHLLGWRCIGYVEMAEYPCKVLEARINDGLLSKAPIYQMHTSKFIKLGLAERYRGLVDVVTAGFPCTPFSRAGKQLGELDERNGWPDTITIIRIVQPRYVLLENSSTLISESYFGTILGDLAASGYDCRWDCIPAKAVGANHERDRVWIVAHANSVGQWQWSDQPIAEPQRNSTPNAGPSSQNVPHAKSIEWDDFGITIPRSNSEVRGSQESTGGCCSSGGCKEEEISNANGQQRQLYQPGQQSEIQQRDDAARNSSERPGSPLPHPNSEGPQRQGLQGTIAYPDWWQTEPALGRVADGVANRVERIRAAGNGQVPAVAAAVWRLLAESSA